MKKIWLGLMALSVILAMGYMILSSGSEDTIYSLTWEYGVEVRLEVVTYYEDWMPGDGVHRNYIDVLINGNPHRLYEEEEIQRVVVMDSFGEPSSPRSREFPLFSEETWKDVIGIEMTAFLDGFSPPGEHRIVIVPASESLEMVDPMGWVAMKEQVFYVWPYPSTGTVFCLAGTYECAYVNHVVEYGAQGSVFYPDEGLIEGYFSYLGEGNWLISQLPQE